MQRSTELSSSALSQTSRRAARQARVQKQGRELVEQGVIITILAILLALTLVPIVLMLVFSLKDNGQIYGRFWSLPNPVRWQNYIDGYLVMWRYIVNTLVSSISSVVAVVLLSSLSGYVFARHRFPAKETIYLVILALLMIPGVLTLIPAFILVKELGLLNTAWVLILPWTAGARSLASYSAAASFRPCRRSFLTPGASMARPNLRSIGGSPCSLLADPRHAGNHAPDQHL
ncbi:MAG: hypothetical protein R2867_29790 [Caldilineaceae bacterium]